VNLTVLYLSEGKPDQAVAASGEATKMDSRSPSAFVSLGWALYDAGQFDRAADVLNHALELGTKIGAVRLLLANVCIKLHRYDNVMEQLDKYLGENPNSKRIQEVREKQAKLRETIQAADIKTAE
jgi:tetratricopeptide (TPR) repeat protein